MINLPYNTIPTFKKPFKNFWKRRKCWLPAFSPLPTVFSTISKTKIIISNTLILLSANTSNLDQSKILSFGKKLTLSSMYTHFNTLKKNKLLEKLLENIVEKGEIAQNEQFHLFPQCFLCNLYLEIL